jgi:hypothetical protein
VKDDESLSNIGPTAAIGNPETLGTQVVIKLLD